MRLSSSELGVCVTSNHQEIASGDVIIFPGVGSFRSAMHNIRHLGIDEALYEAVSIREKKILGICLGFQMMAEFGAEDGGADGLGFIKGRVSQFGSMPDLNSKSIHVGFNLVSHSGDTPLFEGLGQDPYFYFVHSQRLLPGSLRDGIATTIHGEKFVSAYFHDNIFGTQFHPEKKSDQWIAVLRNFLKIAGC